MYYQHAFLRRNIVLILASFLFIFSALFVPLAYSGSFKLIKVDSHYEPKLTLSEYGHYGVILPGTNIKAGSYTYIADNNNEVSRLGFLMGDNRFYYVESDEYNFWGGTTYGAYNGYFVIDAPGYGSTVGANYLMFLIKYDKDSVQLLDVIGQAYIDTYGMDFRSVSAEKVGEYRRINIKDIDRDGNPEIELLIMGHHSEPPTFVIYLEIANDRLWVDFNPELYKPLFAHEKRTIQSKGKSIAYYVYGFLAKELHLKDIKHMLKDNKERYELIITLLENHKKWNFAFHDHGDEKFVLKQYN
jgi:hypothetical protein